MTVTTQQHTTYGPLNDLLAKVTYRPGWRIWVENDHYWLAGTTSGVTLPDRLLHIDAVVADSNQEDYSELRLSHIFAVPPWADHDADRFFNWLAETLIAVERHESREFFKVDGRRFIDPHRDENTRLYA